MTSDSAADLARVEEGDDSIARERRDHEDDLARREMEAVEADALGDRRARREGQHDAEPHQRQEGGQEPAVDGPPPVGDGAAVETAAASVHPSDRLDALDSMHGLPEGFAADLEILELVEAGAGRRQQHDRFARCVAAPHRAAACSTAASSVPEIS